MAISTVKVTAKNINNREDRIKKTTTFIIVLFAILTFVFMLLMVLYNGGRFSISLDPNFSVESGVFMYENEETKDPKLRLYAKEIEFMDNISINWLPRDIANSKGGPHNGDNYIAHTFYVENSGKKNSDYWYEIYIEDVIKSVDGAVRFMIILNGEKKVYAKLNEVTEKEEKGTIAFYSDDIPVVEPRYDLKPGEVDKITIVIWLEGDDPDCVDSIIGGEIKAGMRITEGHREEATR